MKNNINKLKQKLTTLQRKNKILTKITIVLSFIVALTTIYMLKTPAITLNEPITYKLNLIDGYERVWKDENYTTSYNLDLYFMDTSGNYIEGENVSFTLTENGYADHPYGFGYVPYSDAELTTPRGADIINELNLKKHTTSNGTMYEFDHAEVLIGTTWQKLTNAKTRWHIWCYYSSYKDEYDANGQIIPPSDYGWRGRYGDSYTDYTINENTKYRFIYKKVIEGQHEDGAYKLINTLGSDSGITFNLFNYSGDNGNEGNNNINNNGVFDYFTFRGIPGPDLIAGTINSELDGDGFETSTRIKVKPTLESTEKRYPVYDCRGNCTDFSLGYLFGASTNPANKTPKGVTAYIAKNTPLQKTADGEYYYNSIDNAVDFNTDTETFLLRNYKERSYPITTYESTTNRYEFLPFNYWLPGQSLKQNATNQLPYNYESSEVDYWFGMTMEFSFYMPKGGKLNDQDMIFSFSGDDDVWVFIDDTLVLDLGGTHGAVDGTINFATGEVISYLNWNGINSSITKDPETYNETNIYKMYQNANTTSKTKWDGNTYEKYTYHTLKFFYLERGGGVTNCKINFNMPVLPSGTLTVQKQFNGTELKPNEEYEFALYDTTNNNKQPVANAKYTINEIEYYTNSDGKFTLKKDELALFQLSNNHTYYVEETNTKTHAQNLNCSLNGNDCPQNNKTQEFTIDPESAYQAVFINEVKKFDLTIDKIAYLSDENENFEFQLKLKDNNNQSVDIPDSQTSEYLVDHTNGIVTFDLKNEESVTIKDIPIDTLVTLKETKHDGYNVIIKSGDEILANGDTYENFIMNVDKSITVYNTPGVELPETGGSGIIWYLLIGISLIAISIKFGYKYIFQTKAGDE